MVGIALLGGGIWARDEHLPAIEQNPLLSLKAVYSRSQKSADALATLSKDKPDVYFDTPATPEKSLDQLLARSDISAVVIALPILTLPSIVKKALSAGKHVLSEKPISKDVATARELIAFYQRLGRKPVWAVGENLRFVDAVVYGANKLKEIGGTVTTFHMNKFSMVTEDNKYFNTDWRKVPEYQGGFLLDGGVHFVACLRWMLAGAGGQEIDPRPVAAHTTLLEPRLAPVDTVHAVLTTKDGSRSGTFSVSFGTEFKSAFEIQVVTTNGCVTVTPTEVRTTSKNAEEIKKFEFGSGVRQEMDAFAESLEVGTVDPRQTPEMALGDLEILEGMLDMGAKR